MVSIGICFRFSQYSVKDAVNCLYSHGYTHAFIDEIHHSGKEWQRLVKNLYDQFPSMNKKSKLGNLSRPEKIYCDVSSYQILQLLLNNKGNKP